MRLLRSNSVPDEPETIEVTEPETAATGVPAIVTTMSRSLKQMGPTRTGRTLLTVNQPEGFDCPGCAWPEPPPDERKTAEFCENGAKAIAEEAMTERVERNFFASHSLDELRQWSDFALGRAGRLTEPMLKPAGADHFEPVTWDAAFELIAERLNGLGSPDEAVFYTSGRASNEAAYLFQLLARSFGTNNLPDCSNMCHEPTSVALEESVGIGKGTVRLDDIYEADLILLVGQNPGTNHPRMLSALEKTKQNGGQIIAINPLPEAGLLRFKNPQRPRGIIGDGTEIADLHLPIQLGADQALFQLWNHWLVRDGKVDEPFIAQHTSGFEQLSEHLSEVDADELLAATGLNHRDVLRAYEMIADSPRVIVCWAMGVTQHVNAIDTINEIVNLVLLGGHIGRSGAGLCPVRGHSNVQGDRTVGVWEHAEPAFIDALDAEFGIEFPRVDGVDTVDTIRAFRDGKASVFVSLGGNFLRATPDTAVTEAAFGDIDLTVNLSTKLNRSQLVTSGASLVLPCLGRTEVDKQGGVAQFVTVEDSMSLVHSSQGSLDPPSSDVRSEVSIIAGIGARLLGSDHAVDWLSLGLDYDKIRDHVANTVPGFEDFNERVRRPEGFELPNPPRDSRTFETSDGRAHLTPTTLSLPKLGAGELMLQTMRSHDQYNTTIYGHDDRYRGISGNRRVVLMHEHDIAELGYAAGDQVDLITVLPEHSAPGPERRAPGFEIVSYPTPVGTAAAYYPETNVLIPLDHHAPDAQTPASKSVPIRLEAAST